MATGSIVNFKSSFKNELARPNRFDVMMTVPSILDAESSRILTYRCENAQLPGRTFATAEQLSLIHI